MTISRRAFMAAGTASLFGSLATPTIINAQSLGRNDIWTKLPTTVLKSSISLIMDASGSMVEEIEDQKLGHMDALSSPATVDKITRPNLMGCFGIAVNMLSFSDTTTLLRPHGESSYEASWAVLETTEDIQQFRNFIADHAPIIANASTMTVTALEVARASQLQLPHQVAKKVCDLCTDGPYGNDNQASDLYEKAVILKQTVDDMAKRDGIVTNVLAMMDDQNKPRLIMPGEDKHRFVDLKEYYNTFGVNGYQSETDCESGRVFTIRKGGRFIDTITGGLNLKIGYEIG